MRNFALNEMKLLNEMIRLPLKGDAFMHSPIDFSHAHIISARPPAHAPSL